MVQSNNGTTICLAKKKNASFCAPQKKQFNEDCLLRKSHGSHEKSVEKKQETMGNQKQSTMETSRNKKRGWSWIYPYKGCRGQGFQELATRTSFCDGKISQKKNEKIGGCSSYQSQQVGQSSIKSPFAYFTRTQEFARNNQQSEALAVTIS